MEARCANLICPTPYFFEKMTFFDSPSSHPKSWIESEIGEEVTKNSPEASKSRAGWMEEEEDEFSGNWESERDGKSLLGRRDLKKSKVN